MDHFVIKATDRDGKVAWISPLDRSSFRSLTTRQEAATFLMREQAEIAIATIQQSFAKLGIKFTIETA